MTFAKFVGATAGVAAVAAVVTFGLSAQPAAVRGEQGPIRKVILVTIDTLRADRLSTYGYKLPTSPSIDAWAKDALVFERATVQAPWTAPSMASLLTGRYPAETGVYTNRSALRSHIGSLAEVFSAAGIKTAWFNTNPVLMLQRPGFRTGFSDVEPPKKLGKKLPFSQLEPSLYKWLEENADNDFFLWIHNMDPHSPPTEDNPFHKQREWKGYDGEVRLVDSAMGRLFDKLDSLGLSDEVLLIFTSDHGEAFSEHQLPGHQNVIYDEVLHIPLIVRYPGMRRTGRSREPVELLDIYKTIIDLADLPLSPGARGESLVPILDGSSERRQNQYSYHSRYYMQHLGQHHLAVRDREFKLIVKVPFDNPDGAKPAVVMKKKPMWGIDKPGVTFELYNYEDDPGEKTNLIFNGGDPAVVDKLKASILRWRDSVLGSTGGREQKREIDAATRETLRQLGY